MERAWRWCVEPTHWCFRQAAEGKGTAKRFFTGDLQKIVPSYPQAGTELDLLASQIKAINDDCKISPEGYYDEEGNINEDFTFPDLSDPTAWGVNPDEWKVITSDDSDDATIVLKSLEWPGAATIAYGNKFLNIYCGYGFAAKPHEPPPVPPICLELESLQEDPDVIVQPAIPEDDDA